MTQRSNVRPYCGPVTELDAREILARPLLRACADHGPKRVGATLGCDEKTVRNARDEKSTLRIDYVANLLPLDGTALDGFLARVGRRSVPMDAICSTDDRQAQSSVLKAALALSIALEDNEIDANEVRENRQTIENAIDALHGLLNKLQPHRVRA